MNLKVLDQAEADLIEGFHFYESQQPGVGNYFLATLYADIESLRIYAGIHLKTYKNYHRLLSKRFPFAMFYTVNDKPVLFMPSWIVVATQRGCANAWT